MTPELLAPAGGFDAALAAFQYGADAVYLGLPRFSARADAENLTPEQLRTLLAYARSFSPAKKIYVTFNTLVQDPELPQAIETLDTLDDLGPDGVIVQDLGVARLARERFPRLALHASTQLAAHNLDGVLALKALGFTRVVLARELTLAEVRDITAASGVEIEIFVHGALCYGFSGLCLFSSHTAGRSGNRGRCAYCCREAFRANSPQQQGDPPQQSYAFSMRDLALAPLLNAVVATGACSLKIEGRMKSPLYVACVTDYYRRKLDGRLSPAAERLLVEDLQTVFSRPWTRLYADVPDAPPESVIDPVGIGHRGAPIGRVDAVLRDRDGTRWLRFTSSRALEKHDGLQVELPSGGKPFGCAVDLLRAAGSRATAISLPAGAAVEVALPEQNTPHLPAGAPIFCSASQAVRRRYEIRSLRPASLAAGRPADLRVSLSPQGLGVRAEASFERPGDVAADLFLALPLAPSRQPEQTAPAVRKAFERLGESGWRLGALALDDPQGLYAPLSKLNEARRTALEQLTAAWEARRAARRAEIAAAWGLGAAPRPRSGRSAGSSRWTLKLRAEAAPLPAEALSAVGTVVLALGHTPLSALEPALEAWRAQVPQERLRLALPLITRAPERPALKAALRALAGAGWQAWECADLAGAHMLGEAGLRPESCDWSLYALNRASAAELARLGARTFALSPESGFDTALALSEALGPDAPCRPELLVFQHTPLFISETAPCLPGGATDTAVSLTDRRGRAFLTRPLDGRWITVWDSPFCVADRPEANAFDSLRIDLSWSPDASAFPELVRAVTAGRLPAGAHGANADRGLA